MSSTFKLNRTCPTCGCKVSDKSKTGYCTHHRPRTGENNPFFGKHHNFSEEKREEIRKKISENSKRCWASEEYRKLQKEATTGLKRSNEFKEGQRKNAKNQMKDPKQRELRSKKMKESWETGKIVPDPVNNARPNFSKEEIKFGEQLEKVLGKKLLRKQSIRLDDGHWILPDFVLDDFIIEYNGSFWHADPRMYKAEDVIHHNYTARQIWERDEYKREAYKSKGYKLIEVWSEDYHNNPEEVISQVVKKIQGESL